MRQHIIGPEHEVRADAVVGTQPDAQPRPVLMLRLYVHLYNGLRNLATARRDVHEAIADLHVSSFGSGEASSWRTVALCVPSEIRITTFCWRAARISAPSSVSSM